MTEMVLIIGLTLMVLAPVALLAWMLWLDRQRHRHCDFCLRHPADCDCGCGDDPTV